MHYVTTRRLPQGQKSANGTSFTHNWSPSLFTIKWNQSIAEHGSLVSRLQLRGMDILMNDPTVTAVTVLELHVKE